MSINLDLSQVIENGMPVYPGDESIALQQSRRLDKDYFNDHSLAAGMHAGTHLDGPMHLTDSRVFISEIGVDSFIGQGCLLDVRGQSILGLKPEYASSVQTNSVVLLLTGCDRFYGLPSYYTDHPVVSEELCQFFIRRKIKLLGMDMPSPDRTPFPIHKKLLAHGICSLENLTNLDKIPIQKSFEVIALPLKIKANAAWARVIARWEAD
ncbi:MAG TPA: cyclase family protein [Dehalococcoidales bacterium]|nr:cyclase family protein [Dehalococcoidales bacterium]